MVPVVPPVAKTYEIVVELILKCSTVLAGIKISLLLDAVVPNAMQAGAVTAIRTLCGTSVWTYPLLVPVTVVVAVNVPVVADRLKSPVGPIDFDNILFFLLAKTCVVPRRVIYLRSNRMISQFSSKNTCDH